MPKKHYKTGEKTAKKNLDQFLTLDLDQFLTLETPNLGPVFNSTAYIYIYMCVCVCAVRLGSRPILAILKVRIRTKIFNWFWTKVIYQTFTVVSANFCAKVSGVCFGVC